MAPAACLALLAGLILDTSAVVNAVLLDCEELVNSRVDILQRDQKWCFDVRPLEVRAAWQRTNATHLFPARMPPSKASAEPSVHTSPTSARASHSRRTANSTTYSQRDSSTHASSSKPFRRVAPRASRSRATCHRRCCHRRHRSHRMCPPYQRHPRSCPSLPARRLHQPGPLSRQHRHHTVTHRHHPCRAHQRFQSLRRHRLHLAHRLCRQRPRRLSLSPCEDPSSCA